MFGLKERGDQTTLVSRMFASTGTYTVTINHSEIFGGTTIDTDTEFTTLVGSTLLSGDTVAGDVTCAGVYDENYDFYADTCP